jgi:Peptidase family M28
VDVDPALREVVEELAPITRGPGSPGEAEAARLIAERLRAAGCVVEIEPATFQDGYARPLGMLCTAATAGGLLALSGRARRTGGLLAAGAGLAVADDVANGPRLFRRLFKRKPTQNVVAVAGDPDAERTLVLLAHHDAAPTGMIFDPTVQAWFGERVPSMIERIDTSTPLWWLVLAGPALIAAGVARGRRLLTALGTVASLLSTATFANVARGAIVPGANDNLSSVAVLVALAQRLRQRPIPGLRVLLVSCGAEEVIQGGIYGFAERHFPTLDRDRSWVLTLECVGSPRLALLEGEGAIVMEDYCDVRFRDLIARIAHRDGIPLRRGMRSRNSTDAVIPSRAGYSTATLVSLDRNKAISNYHLPSDTPENLDYTTIQQALELTEAVAHELAANRWL